eukprot:256512-Pelagomonas_calceolata.AAC.5
MSSFKAQVFRHCMCFINEHWRQDKSHLGRGCSGMGCASTRMILPPSVLAAERSRVACRQACA